MTAGFPRRHSCIPPASPPRCAACPPACRTARTYLNSDDLELEPYPTSADLNPVVKRLEHIQAHGCTAASGHLPHFFLAAEDDFSGQRSLEILFEELAEPAV